MHEGHSPAGSKDMEDILTAIELCKGKDVLIVMDSWDEYPLKRCTDSLFEKPIWCPEDIKMQASSVLITSRPIASGKLHSLVSSRVEIVGFTPAEVKRYFTEVLKGDSDKVHKLEEHLRERPLVQASCYLPLNASIVAHLFLELKQDLPSTLHGVFASLVICCLIRHLNRQSKAGILKDVPNIPSLNEVPAAVQEDFNRICTLAYHGVEANKYTFSPQDLRSFNLPTEVSTLSLLKGVENFTCR